MDARANFAFGTLASGINSAALTCDVGAGEGARFPAVSFNAVIWNKTDYPDPAHAYWANQAEIVRVTNIATDTLTITRAQEGTIARDFNTGGKTYEIWAGPTDGYWDQLFANGEVMTTRGDLVRRGASNPERLALGATDEVLYSDGTDAKWGKATKNGFVASDQATTSATAVNVTDMVFAIGVNEVWSVEFWLVTNVTAAGGMKLAVDVPSGATVGGGVRGSASVRASITSTALTAVIQSGAGEQPVLAHILVQNGANAGNVQLQFASGDGIVTATIRGDRSYFVARRIS